MRAAGFFVLRTPLLAFDELAAWSQGLEAAAAPDRDRAAAVARDRARLRARLRDLIARPEVREALFVASPSLAADVDAWQAAPDGKRGRKVERALVRYVQRMAARATPFGLFGGCTVGELGAATQLVLAPRAAGQRHTRLDMDYVAALTATLAADPAMRAALVHRPNTSLYRAAGQIRYMEGQGDGAGGTQGGPGRRYRLVAVAPTAYLDAVLAHARQGARPGALAAALVADDPEIELEDAARFVDALIDRQILVPEMLPALTGPEPIHDLLGVLADAPEVAADARAAASVLGAARAALVALDQGGLGAEPARYHAIARTLADAPAPPALARLFQVDLSKPASAACLGAAPVAEIARGIELLRRIAPPGSDSLARFREAFRARYQGREVPLMEVLDEESGIGFGSGMAAGASPLLAGLDFAAPGAGADAGAPGTPWEARHAWLQRKLVDTLRAGAAEMVLDAGDLADLTDLADLARADAPPLPPALAVLAVLAAPSAGALARGDFRVHVRGARGPSGAELLARFCHADARIEACARALVAAEEAHAPAAIHAEIVHLPEDRVGNILLRPLLRGHEIPYLGRSGAPPDRQIGVDDLLVSVAGGRVILRSRRLGREVLPRLTTAHSVRDGLRVYRFLGTLAHQGTAGGLRWHWGPLEHSPYLPRVVAGRLVLDPARWRLDAAALAPLASAGERLFAAAQALRERLALPRHVALVEADNLLPVDLDNILSIEAFAQLVAGRGEARLVEMFPGPDALCAHGPEGRFVHEIVIPFVREPAPDSLSEYEMDSRSRSESESVSISESASESISGLESTSDSESESIPESRSVTRCFMPGSEWLYVKLYCGPATADRVLRGLVMPLLREARAAGAMDGWFFLRYSDPDPHLRLRLHGEPGRLLGEVLPRLHEAAAPLLADQRLWRVQLDTYEREVERYGGDEGTLLAEQLFAADSGAVLALLEMLAGDAAWDARWRLTLCGMDHLLRDLGLTLHQRCDVVARARATLGRTLGVGVDLQRQLGMKYRAERLALAPLLDAEPPADHPLAPALEVLRRRSARLEPVATALRQAEAAGRLRAPLATLAGHYIHMHANRLLRAPALEQELVIYDLLARLYRSRLARSAQRP